MRDYVVDQLKTSVIPKLEQVSGKKYDEDRLKELLARSAQAEDDLVWVLESAKTQAVADRRLLRRNLLPRPDLLVVQRDAGRGGVLPSPARRGRGDDSIRAWVRSRRMARSTKERYQGRGRGAAELDPLPRVLEDVRRRRAPSSSPRPTPRSAASTTTVFATIRAARWRPSPSTAWGVTRISIYPAASRCSRAT